MTDTPAAARALAILQRLAQSPEPLAAGHLATQLDIPKASLYRLLNTLADHGFVSAVGETNRWALGIASYELAWAYQRQNPLQRAARPLIERLVDTTGHNGHFTVLRGTDVVYVVEERAPHRPSLVTDVGVRLPAHLTASGLAILSALTTPQISALYPDATSLITRAGQGPTTVTALRAELRAVRARGYALEEHLITEGLCSVALPVLDAGGHPIGAVALTYPAEDGAAEARLVEAVRRTVAALQARLGVRRRST